MRVLLVQRTLDPPGGGNAVAAWMLHALSERHQVSTLTTRAWNADAVDRYFGTSLASRTIPQLLPGPAGSLVRTLPGRLDRLRMAVLLRTAQRRAGEFDVMMTADNYAAFRRPGIQYVHYPAALRPMPDRWRMVVDVYYRACDGLSGLAWESARDNMTLANSEWTARGLINHGINARVVYPPVADPGTGRPWSERSDTFLAVGRFNGSKRFELAVDIVHRARAFLPNARLIIVGSNVDAEYTTRLRALEQRFGSWLSIREDLAQRDLFALMGQCRYGIHAMDGEHFGMAVAEMARAGCIVFVHDSGGQVEAVGRAGEIVWNTPDEAVNRIRAVAGARALQEDLSDRVRAHAERFATERFVSEIRQLFDAYGTAMARKPGSRSSSS